MSLYPPLTSEQLNQLRHKVSLCYELRRNVADSGLTLVLDPGDEDDLLRTVVEMRGWVQKLDLELFRLLGIVHCYKESNVPTTLPQPKVRPTTDSLMELLK